MTNSNGTSGDIQLDLHKMLSEIDEIVSGDWGYSVTDDMVNLPDGSYKEFTQEQAQEMAQAIGKVYMIAHCIHCTGCQYHYATNPVDDTQHRRNDKPLESYAPKATPITDIQDTELERPEGYPTVVSGDYSIPKHSNWVEVDSKYLVDFNDVVEAARGKSKISKQELRASVLGVLHRINNEEDSSNYVLGSILAEWCDDIMFFVEQYAERVVPENSASANTATSQLASTIQAAQRELLTELDTDVYLLETHYGCGKNDEEFVKGDDPTNLCCDCYSHKSCIVRPEVEDFRKAVQAVIAKKKEELT